jgi:hypothetical protein
MFLFAMVPSFAFVRYNRNEEANAADAGAHLARTQAAGGNARDVGDVGEAREALVVYTSR